MACSTDKVLTCIFPCPHAPLHVFTPLSIYRILQQERAIIAVDRALTATLGTSSERFSKDRTNAYDAVLRTQQTETNALRDKLNEARSARLDKRTCDAVPLDIASHQILIDLQRRIRDAEARTSEAHKKVLSLPFDPESTGRLVVNRQRSLVAENKELVRQAVTGRHGQLKCEIALYRRQNADIKAAIEDMESYTEQLDDEVSTLQQRVITLRSKRQKAGARDEGAPAHSTSVFLRK